MATGYTATPQWPSSSTTTPSSSMLPSGRAHDRTRFFSLSDARYGAGGGSSSETTTQAMQALPSGKRLPSSRSLGGTSMHTSFSSDSLLNMQNRPDNRSSPIALPPLRSLVNGINGIESDTGEASDALGGGPPLPFSSGSSKGSAAAVGINEASPVRGHARRASLATSLPERNGIMKKSEAILNRIYSSSLALADYAQMSQQSLSGPTAAEMANMQQFAADLNSLIVDLKYQADISAVDRPRLPEPVVSMKAAPDYHNHIYRDAGGALSDSEHRRRSSGAASFVSFDLNNSSVRSFHDGSSSERRLSASIPRFNGHHNGHRFSDGGMGADASSYSDFSHQGYASQDTPESGMKASPSSNSDNAIQGSSSDLQQQQQQQQQQTGGRPHKYRKRSRAPAPGSCLACGVEETPEWRRGPGGARTLCNACGLHYSKMVRKVKTELGDKAPKGNNSKNNAVPLVSIEELRASILLPATSTNGSDMGSTTGTI